ncbi:MAG: pyridoxal phosphate-dependent aminotransferase family protein [Flavobacteriaceae bacterium]|nr:pyridoxal phosphate-dependent aminotransferase family protein [Flavobacteriaceae bacterium]
MFPDKLHNKLSKRIENDSLRTLGKENNLVDFSSNDYLGFAKSDVIFKNTHQFLIENDLVINGSTGSRLLSGNHSLYTALEKQLCQWHQSEASLIFNSGYNANLGFFSCVPQRGDVILYDEYSHASIRDGIQLSHSKSYKFHHNNLKDLKRLLARYSELNVHIYVVTESVFSMDGDSPNLIAIVNLCKQYNANLIVDEAHAVGVFGIGLVQTLNFEEEVFARIVTFGKALGCHGAAVLGSRQLIDYLVNFSRPFIYTTGLSPHSLVAIKCSYEELVNSYKEEKSHSSSNQLKNNIQFFSQLLEKQYQQLNFIKCKSAIQSCIISGNEKVKSIAGQLQKKGFDVKPILSPTVPEGEERLRFCLHSYNTQEQIAQVLALLCKFA